MVKIVDFKERKNDEGTSFYVLEVQGGVELVQSQSTGNYYATTKKAYIPTTFGDVMCATLVGQELDGSIVKRECEPYVYVVKETGEEVILSHRWVFTPEKEEAVKIKQDGSDALFVNLNAFSNLYPKQAEFAS